MRRRRRIQQTKRVKIAIEMYGMQTLSAFVSTAAATAVVACRPPPRRALVVVVVVLGRIVSDDELTNLLSKE